MTKNEKYTIIGLRQCCADMAELADAPDLGSGVFDVQVQVLLSAVKNPRKSGVFLCTANHGFILQSYCEEENEKRQAR